MADAYLHVLDLKGGTPHPARLHLLDLKGRVAPRAYLHVLDLVGDVVVSLVANAGADQTVDAGARVQLNGGASSGRPTRFFWQMTGGDGPAPTFDPSPYVQSPSFLAPYTPLGCEIRLTLAVALDDDEDFTASPDEVVITVRPHPLFTKVGGVRVPVALSALARMVGLP